MDEVGGLHGGGPQAPPGSHAEAGRDRETGNGGHDDRLLLLELSGGNEIIRGGIRAIESAV